MDRFAWIELRPVQRVAQARGKSASAPRDATSFCEAASAMRRAGHFKDAAHYYQHAVGLNESLHQAQAERIDCLVRAGLLDEADKASAHALDNFRQVRLHYASRALVLAHTGRLGEAFLQSDVGLEQNTQWYPRLVRAELLLLAGRDNLPEVLRLLEQVIENSPEPWDAHFLGGWMLLQANLPAHASGYFSEAIHAQPRAVAGWIGMGDAFQAMRLYEQALFYYQRATDIEPTHELALDRQRRCGSSRFGLLRMFRWQDLRRRWNRRFEKELPE